MKKDIHYADDARKQLLKWVETVANVVKVTMWPKGRNVILDKWFGAPTVTNDGVSVAKEIELEDKVENVWAEMVKEAAKRVPELRYIGWDVAITEKGPAIIEGNECPSYGPTQNYMLNPNKKGHLKRYPFCVS